jgi:uncharacterized protein
VSETSVGTERPNAGQPRVAGPLIRVWLAIELVGLYWVGPVFIDFTDRTQGRLLMPGLLAVAALLFAVLWFDRRFDRRSLWNLRGFRAEAGRICGTAVIAFGIMLALAWWVSEQAWAPMRDGEVAIEPLALLQRAPIVVLAICVLYPLLSVYPQEIILRTFFFHRYGPLFGRTWITVIGSALTFAWVHMIFVADKGDPLQWIPVYLCIPAGLLFGYTYAKTKSTIASGFEHALVGDFMWIAGLGWFFFAGGAVANGG